MEEIQKRLQNLVNRDLTKAQICAALKLPTEQVNRELQRWGLFERQKTGEQLAEKILRLRDSGCTPESISAHLNMSITVIKNKLHQITENMTQYKVKTKFAWTPDKIEIHNSMRKEGKSIEQIADHLGVTPLAVTKKRLKLDRGNISNPKGKVYTPEDDQFIIDRRKEGAPFSIIAVELGRSSQGAVYNRHQQLMNRLVKNENATTVVEKNVPTVSTIVKEVFNDPIEFPKKAKKLTKKEVKEVLNYNKPIELTPEISQMEIIKYLIETKTRAIILL